MPESNVGTQVTPTISVDEQREAAKKGVTEAIEEERVRQMFEAKLEGMDKVSEDLYRALVAQTTAYTPDGKPITPEERLASVEEHRQRLVEESKRRAEPVEDKEGNEPVVEEPVKEAPPTGAQATPTPTGGTPVLVDDAGALTEEEAKILDDEQYVQQRRDAYAALKRLG